MRRKLSEKDQFHKTQRFLAGTEAASRVLVYAVKYGALIWVAKYVYLSVVSLSGKETLAIADLGLKVLANIGLGKWLCILLAGGSGGWAIGERRMRRKMTAEYAEKLKKYEMERDNNRTSSQLPPSGQTRQGD